jgi:hypothetical protein
MYFVPFVFGEEVHYYSDDVVEVDVRGAAEILKEFNNIT